ncbi:thiopurine S-methyltransferase [Microbulbifer sp. YPW1]|uniref:thiopurine S-methyltransferase n=1 Tax=Microbulbifer sp. YPW1 TaxID=2745199 RepID=UPI00159B45B5|nr:thiopurine S-methyltransferase [Microbulbifer sp. YPW1]QKX18404.1 thiopurine S-methyltransferase [Microbulbifer sp. YPW1]
MEHEFWHDKWRRNEIGFHNREAHPLLVEHFARLGLEQGDRLFLPLCGKTLDIGWLLERGYAVAGAELSEMAVIQLFEQLGIDPQVDKTGDLKRYSAPDIDIFVGDILHLTREVLGPVAAVYDRAALVALPLEMRRRYAEHLVQVTGSAPQLLITFEYDQEKMPGPPFCVNDEEVAEHYAASYTLNLLQTVDVEGGLKGKCPAEEKIWLLESKSLVA